MPEFLTPDSRPIFYVVTIQQRLNIFEFAGKAMDGTYDAAKNPDERVQVLPYGIAQWHDDRTRTVYPWHEVLQIEETFR